MSQPQSSKALKRIRRFFAKDDELVPLQYLQELYDWVNRSEDKEQDPKDKELELKRMRRWIPLGKFIARIFLKPLLRFDNLLSTKQRAGIELLVGQSSDADLLWMTSDSNLLKRYVASALENADSRERPLVWLAWCVSPDLIYAFDAQPFCTEALSVFGQFLGDRAEQVIDLAEQAGVAPEHCSATKTALGGCLTDQLPRPTCVVTSSHPCDSMLSSYQSIEYMIGAPTFMLDTPNWEDKRSMDYYAEEIRRLIAFLEEHLDRKLDYDRLREVLTEVNETNELLMEIKEMYRAVPCPATNLSGVAHWFYRVLGLGTPEVTEMARRLHRITKERLDAGRGVIKKEKIRVIWFDVPIVFYPIQIWMEETFGAVTIVDLLTYVNTPQIDTSTPETMIRGLAETYINLNMAGQFHGPIDYFHNDLARICEEYNGDCFIFAGHAGCKHTWATTRILKNYMKKINMPLLILTSDIFDQRLTNEKQLKARIEEFG